MLNLLTNSKS